MTKRKREDLPIEKKKEIIAAAKENSNQTSLGKQFGVPRSTVQDILKAKDKIESAVDEGVPLKRKRLTQAYEPRIDEAVLKWMKQARGQNLPVGGDLLKASFCSFFFP
jgi:transposase-like protein